MSGERFDDDKEPEQYYNHLLADWATFVQELPVVCYELGVILSDHGVRREEIAEILDATRDSITQTSHQVNRSLSEKEVCEELIAVICKNK